MTWFAFPYWRQKAVEDSSFCFNAVEDGLGFETMCYQVYLDFGEGEDEVQEGMNVYLESVVVADSNVAT